VSNNLRSRMGHIVATVAFTLLAAGALTTAPALAAAGEGCPNEQVRRESNTNPTIGQPYSVGLPECRAYEMVSPLDKQAHDAFGPGFILGIPVSPDGSAIGWASVGDYAGAENFHAYLTAGPYNPYLARRAASGWITRSGFAPARLVKDPGFVGVDPPYGVFSPDLSREVSCGGDNPRLSVACALREPSGSWLLATPSYTILSGLALPHPLYIRGASRDLSDVVLQLSQGSPGRQRLLPSDTSTSHSCPYLEACAGLYEITDLGGETPDLQLVDVDNNGNMVGPESPTSIGAVPEDQAAEAAGGGTSYQAVSEDGSKIYFTATPNASNSFGSSTNVQTIFARVDGTSTVDVSNPSPSACTRCTQEAEEGKPENSEAKPATFEGASLDGSKVFFTTSQQLVNADTDATSDLYEYDFNKPSGQRIVQVSGGGAGDLTPGTGANGGSIVSLSEAGSHAYFVAEGVLTTLPNGLGQTAVAGSQNLYGFDTETNQTKFVATLTQGDGILTGERTPPKHSGIGHQERLAQTTPDGRYLLFDSFAKLITAGPEADTSGAQQVYRYDFQTGDLVRISISHEGFGNNGTTPGLNAVIAPKPIGDEGEGTTGAGGALPTINDINRAISDDGSHVVFMTAQQFQGNDTNGGSHPSSSCPISEPSEQVGCDVYEWHECAGGPCADGESGVVNLISDGQEPAEQRLAAISATGSDIFFETKTQLVGQDTDELGDIYDARVDGGFPAPTPEPSCSGEACQGSAAPSPAFGALGTSSITGGGNVTPGSTSFPAPTESKVAVTISKRKLSGRSVTLVFRLTAKGAVTITGYGLKRYSKTLGAGSHQVKVALSKVGLSLRPHHRKIKIKVALRSGGKASSAATTLKL
jgi:hypothetical protein